MSFTPRTEAPSRDDPLYHANNPFYQSGYGMPNCTAYAYSRFWEILGSKPSLCLWDAEEWWSYDDGYDRGQKPKLGAVIVWEGLGDEAGHVAIVEAINSNGSFVISQSAWEGTYWWTQTINADCYFGSGYRFLGFIYNPAVDDSDEDEVPTPVSGNRYLSLSEMQANATYIWWYLKNKGWSLNAVCGMLGNMQRESTINPGIWQDLDEGNTSLGYGLVQWTPATNYINWCDSNGLTPSHMDSNLKRIIYELENGLQYYSTADYPESFREFSVSTKSVEYLVTAFLKNYERAGVEALDERIENGNYWFSYLQNINFDDDDDPPHNPIYFKRKSGYKFVLFKKKGVIRK